MSLHRVTQQWTGQQQSTYSDFLHLITTTTTAELRTVNCDDDTSLNYLLLEQNCVVVEDFWMYPDRSKYFLDTGREETLAVNQITEPDWATVRKYHSAFCLLEIWIMIKSLTSTLDVGVWRKKFLVFDLFQELFYSLTLFLFQTWCDISAGLYFMTSDVRIFKAWNKVSSEEVSPLTAPLNNILIMKFVSANEPRSNVQPPPQCNNQQFSRWCLPQRPLPSPAHQRRLSPSACCLFITRYIDLDHGLEPDPDQPTFFWLWHYIGKIAPDPVPILHMTPILRSRRWPGFPYCCQIILSLHQETVHDHHHLHHW